MKFNFKLWRWLYRSNKTAAWFQFTTPGGRVRNITTFYVEGEGCIGEVDIRRNWIEKL